MSVSEIVCDEMALADASEERRRNLVSVDAMLLMRAIRKTDSVKSWLNDPNVLAADRGGGVSSAQIAECRQWLVGAIAFEQANGRGSLIDRTHPFWIEDLEPALRRATEIVEPPWPRA